jgi:hypothetical protein
MNVRYRLVVGACVGAFAAAMAVARLLTSANMDGRMPGPAEYASATDLPASLAAKPRVPTSKGVLGRGPEPSGEGASRTLEDGMGQLSDPVGDDLVALAQAHSSEEVARAVERRAANLNLGFAETLRSLVSMDSLDFETRGSLVSLMIKADGLALSDASARALRRALQDMEFRLRVLVELDASRISCGELIPALRTIAFCSCADPSTSAPRGTEPGMVASVPIDDRSAYECVVALEILLREIELPDVEVDNCIIRILRSGDQLAIDRLLKGRALASLSSDTSLSLIALLIETDAWPIITFDFNGAPLERRLQGLVACAQLHEPWRGRLRERFGVAARKDRDWRALCNFCLGDASRRDAGEIRSLLRSADEGMQWATVQVLRSRGWIDEDCVADVLRIGGKQRGFIDELNPWVETGRIP